MVLICHTCLAKIYNTSNIENIQEIYKKYVSMIEYVTMIVRMNIQFMQHKLHKNIQKNK